MTKNDTFYKILFAIEIALMPLVIAASILLPAWSVSVFIAGLLIVKIWLKLFKDKEKSSHIIINAISSVATIMPLVIFFTFKGYIAVYLCVLVSIFVLLMSLFNIYLKNKIFQYFYLFLNIN